MSVSVFGVVVVVELALDVFPGVFVEEGEDLVAALVAAFGDELDAGLVADLLIVLGFVSLDEVLKPLCGDHDVPPAFGYEHGDDG